MSTLPEEDPLPSTDEAARRRDALSHEEVLKAVHNLFPYDLPEPTIAEPPPAPAIAEDRPLFQSWSEPEPLPPPTRHPNFLDVLLLAALAVVGLLAAGLLTVATSILIAAIAAA